MRRRELIAGIVGTAAIPPVFAWAQQPGSVPRIGVLVLGNPDPAVFLREFREGLRNRGYVEGKNVVFEFRTGGGSNAQLAIGAGELVALKVDLIVAWQTPAVIAAKEATSEIPIIMSPAGDPVGTGLIASLARPGGNLTGFSGATAELAGKNLELIREVLPSARRVGVLANAADPFHKPFLAHIEAAARTLGLEIKTILVPKANELEAAFAEIAMSGAEALVVQPSLPRAMSAELALKNRLPGFSPSVEFVPLGGLMSYSADVLAIYRDVADFVDKVLKGRKPADLPVQLPTKYLLVINLKTANALGLKLPPTLLTRADQVIE